MGVGLEEAMEVGMVMVVRGGEVYDNVAWGVNVNSDQKDEWGN